MLICYDEDRCVFRDALVIYIFLKSYFDQANKFDMARWGWLALYSNIDGLVQDCSNSIANAMELLHSCIKPSI